MNERRLLETLCKSVVACLNSRDVPVRPGAIVVGVTGECEEKPSVITGLPLLTRCDFESRLCSALEHVVYCRSGGDDEPKRLTPQEISALVKVERVAVAAPLESAKAPTKEGVVYAALVTVLPNWHICQNRSYNCRFPDKNGIPLKPQVYEYHRGSTVELKPSSIGGLERHLKAKYDAVRDSSSRR